MIKKEIEGTVHSNHSLSSQSPAPDQTPSPSPLQNSHKALLESGFTAVDPTVMATGGGYGLLASGIGILQHWLRQRTLNRLIQKAGKPLNKSDVIEANQMYAIDLKRWAWGIKSTGFALQTMLEIAYQKLPLLEGIQGPRNFGHTLFALGVQMNFEAEMHRRTVVRMCFPCSDAEKDTTTEEQRFTEILGRNTRKNAKFLALGGIGAAAVGGMTDLMLNSHWKDLGYIMGIVLGAAFLHHLTEGIITQDVNSEMKKKVPLDRNTDRQFHQLAAPREMAAGAGIIAAGLGLFMAGRSVNPYIETSGMILVFKGVYFLAQGLSRTLSMHRLKSRYDRPGGMLTIAAETCRIARHIGAETLMGRNRHHMEKYYGTRPRLHDRLEAISANATAIYRHGNLLSR